MKLMILFLIVLITPCLLFPQPQAQTWLTDHWYYSHYTSGGVTLRDATTFGWINGWVVGDEGKVFKLEFKDVVGSFELLDGDYDFHGVSFVDPGQYGWICGNYHWIDERGVLLKIDEYANILETYYPQIGSNRLACYDVAFANANDGYLACSDGYVLKSSDGGMSWLPTLRRPYPDEDTTICIVHVEVTSEDEVWCVGDNMGVVAHSTNSGDDWNTKRPFYYTYDDLPDPGEQHPGRMANFVICPNDPDNIDAASVGLSHGRYGWTTDGGDNWYSTATPSPAQWLNAVGSFITDDFLFGNSGYMDSWNGYYYTKDYDLVGCNTYNNFLHYVTGNNEAILYFSEGGQGFGDIYCYITDLELIPPSPNYTDRVRVKWRAHNYSSTNWEGVFHIYLSFCEEGPFFEIHTEPSNIPAGQVVNFEWDDDVFPEPPNTLDNLPRHYYVDMTTGERIYGDMMIHTIGELPFPTPSEIPTFSAQDAAVDEGWETELSWTCNVPSQTFHIYKHPKRMSERYAYLATTANYALNDNMALTGYEFEYRIRRNMSYLGQVVAYSDPEICVGASADEVPPDQVTYHEYSYDPQTHTLFISWNPLDDPTLGGYWFCPTTVGESHSLSQLAPITRTWYKDYYIYWETGQQGLVAVCAMDRSYNVGEWHDEYIQVPLTTATSTNATYANNGERLQRDANGNMYLAFTSGNPDSIYFSQSSDGGAHWTKESVAEGSYPVLMLYGSYLHLLWIKDKTTDQAKLMYAWKSISVEGFSTGSCLLNINADPTIESMGPPSLAVSRDSLFVTWESRMSPPLSFYSGLFVGTLPNTRAASPPFYYEMLGLGSLLHTICPSETDTIMESVCPSTSVDERGNPYIVWDRINPNTGFFDIVAWERNDGDWFSGVISNTADCADEEEPYLTYENGVLHCVWSGTENNGGEPFNIYHSQKYPGQPNERWDVPEIVYNSEFNSSTPVYERGHIIWSEDEKNIMMVRYDYGDLEWQTSPPETIAKADSETVININPVATSTTDTLFIVWSNKDKFNNYYIHYDEKPILEISPRYAVNTGLEEEGAFTVERDGNQTLGEKYYKTIDHSTTNLIYKIRGLDEKPGQDLKLIFYHEFNDAIKLKVKIDHIWMNIWVQPAETVSVEEMIPVSCLGDGKIKITIKSVPPTQNAPAVCSAIWFYDETGGGGPMSSGERETPFIYSLKTPFPSPFKDNTTIYYSIAQSGKVSLKIYDITGRCINVLENGVKDPDVYSVRWNGYDKYNQKVPTGVYFIRLSSRDFASVKKVILLR
ncbi:T9SS type A sorting domain-containing protein [candidate division WOR-3 bacterium]|nr:T9SS type A sorting domain-containing protein [candidate division WOR-3 bacterium]